LSPLPKLERAFHVRVRAGSVVRVGSSGVGVRGMGMGMGRGRGKGRMTKG